MPYRRAKPAPLVDKTYCITPAAIVTVCVFTGTSRPFRSDGHLPDQKFAKGRRRKRTTTSTRKKERKKEEKAGRVMSVAATPLPPPPGHSGGTDFCATSKPGRSTSLILRGLSQTFPLQQQQEQENQPTFQPTCNQQQQEEQPNASNPGTLFLSKSFKHCLEMIFVEPTQSLHFL